MITGRNLGAKHAYCCWAIAAPGPSQGTEGERTCVCMYERACSHTCENHVFTLIPLIIVQCHRVNSTFLLFHICKSLLWSEDPASHYPLPVGLVNGCPWMWPVSPVGGCPCRGTLVLPQAQALCGAPPHSLGHWWDTHCVLSFGTHMLEKDEGLHLFLRGMAACSVGLPSRPSLCSRTMPKPSLPSLLLLAPPASPLSSNSTNRVRSLTHLFYLWNHLQLFIYHELKWSNFQSIFDTYLHITFSSLKAYGYFLFLKKYVPLCRKKISIDYR